MKQSATTLLVSLLFFLLPAGELRAVNLDSLLVVANQEKDPQKKADRYLEYIGKFPPTQRDSAIDLLIRAEEAFDNYGKGRALSLRAWYVLFKAKYEESLNLGHQALAIQRSINDSFGIALTLNRIGLANMRFKRVKEAERYVTIAHRYFSRLKDSAKMDMTLNNLGVIAFDAEKLDKAVGYYKQSLAIREARKDYYWVGYAYYNIAQAFLKLNQLDSAGVYMNKAYDAFQNRTESGVVPPMVSLGMGELYNALGNYALGYSYIKKGYDEAVKQDHKELILMGKAQLADLLFKLKKFREAYEMQEEYLEMKNANDSINSAEKVAEVELKFETAEKEAEIAKLTSQKLEAETAAQKQKLYTLIIAIVFILLSAAVIFILYRRNQKQKIEQSNLNTKIAETKMIALKAQMNPHFIFNCINTAQNFVVNNQKEQAYEYLSNFARLLRMVMENSAKTYIPLEDEIKQLRLYMELEAIRFSNKFSYSIHIDPQLEEGVFEIPGMIMQPLVENAIGHGLINRNDDKGELHLSLTLSGNNILCEITDNGVGREKAAEIKSQKNIRYQSAAIPNIKERISILQNENNSDIKLEIEDVIADHQIAGTKVILLMPFH